MRVKRLGRYLIGKQRLQQWFEWQDAPTAVHTYRDADWPGCRETRKSTTGGAVLMGKHSIKSWSKTQALIALSSGESELYATFKAAAETLGTVSMLRGYGAKVKTEVRGDAQAALGIIHRKGLGKTRHFQIGLLWIQQVSAEKKRLKVGTAFAKLTLPTSSRSILTTNHCTARGEAQL